MIYFYTFLSTSIPVLMDSSQLPVELCLATIRENKFMWYRFVLFGHILCPIFNICCRTKAGLFLHFALECVVSLPLVNHSW